jgi:hypothetical protein
VWCTWNQLITFLTFWESNGTNVVVFDGPITQAKIYFASSRCSFRCCANTSLFLCRATIMTWLLTCFSTASFHLSSTHFLTSFHICLSIPHLTMSHLLWCRCGHTINDLGIHLLRCMCGRERTAGNDTFQGTIVIIALGSEPHIEKGFSPFPLPHTKMNEYCHHQSLFSYLGGCYHYWSDSYRFGVACFNDDSACNDNCHSRQGIILHRLNVKRWFHSPCHKDLWLFPSSFWFIFDFLCTCLYNSPSIDLLGTLDAYISL